MMSLCHGWGWQPPQTAFPIHLRHLQSLWTHWYAVHRHKVAALHSHTHTTWLRFGGSGSLMELKWCHYFMVEADSHLKLLPTSILDIYRVFEHIDIYAVYRHMVAALHSYPPYLAQILGFWVTYGVEMMSLCHGWGWQLPRTTSRTYIRHIESVWDIDMLSIGIWKQPYTVIQPTWLRFGGFESLMWSQNDVITSWLRLTATLKCFPHPF